MKVTVWTHGEAKNYVDTITNAAVPDSGVTCMTTFTEFQNAFTDSTVANASALGNIAAANYWHTGNAGTGYAWGCTTLTATGKLSVAVNANDVAEFKNSGSGIGVVTLGSNGTYGTRLNIKNAANTANAITLSYDGTGTFSSDVSIGGNITLTSSTAAKYIYMTDKPASGSGTARSVLHLDTNNNLGLGYGTAGAGYNTYIDGNEIYLRYSTSHTKGVTLNSSGNVTLGNSDLATDVKLYVNGHIAVNNTVYFKNQGWNGITADQKNGGFRFFTTTNDDTPVTREVLRLNQNKTAQFFSNLTISGNIITSGYYYSRTSDNRIYMRDSVTGGTNTDRLVFRYVSGTTLDIGSGVATIASTNIYGTGIKLYPNNTSATHHDFTATGATIAGSLAANNLTINPSSGTPVCVTTASGTWNYLRFIVGDTSTNFWDLGTITTTATYIGQANAFEIRDGLDSYSGISIRHATSSFGKLVVSVPSGQASIGYWSTSKNPVSGYPIWTSGYTADTSDSFGWYYKGTTEGWLMTLSSSGSLTVPKINLNRSSASTAGRLSFYSDTYKTWFFYMSPRSSGVAPNGSTPPKGTFVTSWALRTVVENSSGYGWTWESQTNNSTSSPNLIMELSSNTGNLWLLGNLSANGAITAGSASDVRLKYNIKTMTDADAIKFVMALRPVTFTWNAKATSLYDKYVGDDSGFIAQEVQPLMPKAVSPIFEEYLRIQPEKFVAPLVKVAQSHEMRIKRLEDENDRIRKENLRLIEENNRLIQENNKLRM